MHEVYNIIKNNLFFNIVINIIYYDIGIDYDGNAANFIETEQIVYYKTYCCSHI